MIRSFDDEKYRIIKLFERKDSHGPQKSETKKKKTNSGIGEQGIKKENTKQDIPILGKESPQMDRWMMVPRPAPVS